MSKTLRAALAGMVALLGVGLMVGGVVTHKGGAVVVGLIVAAVATQQWIALRRQPSQGDDLPRVR